MSKVKFKLNKAGVAELLKSKEMQDILQREGEAVRGRCTAGTVGPEEYGAEIRILDTRAVAVVHASTVHAYRSNLKHNTLVKALGGGG